MPDSELFQRAEYLSESDRVNRGRVAAEPRADPCVNFMAGLRRGKALRMERMQTYAAGPTILRKLGRSVCDVGGAVVHGL